MTETEAILAIQCLTRAFRLGAPPTLRWSARDRRGHARLGDRITVGPRCWRGVEDTLLHEVAHIMTFRRGGNAREHSERFYLHLVAIVQEHYGDSRRYGWATEYKRLKARARRDGLLRNDVAADAAGWSASPRRRLRPTASVDVT